MILRPTASSICRSCAGVSSLSKMTTSTSVSAHDAASVCDLAGAEKRRRIGLRPLLQHAQHDLRAGGLGQAGELVERSLGVEPPRAAGDQADERRALARRATARSQRMPERLSHEIAPARTSRGSAPVTSTIVDGGPPGVGRHRAADRSRVAERRARPRPDRRSPAAPLRFALVAVSGRPHARAQRARDRVRRHAHADASRCRRSPPAPARRARGISSVSGPGQKRSRQPTRERRQRAEHCRDLSTSAATSGSARSAARPLTANTRATAAALNGSAARPYSVSVGSATTPPRRGAIVAASLRSRVADRGRTGDRRTTPASSVRQKMISDVFRRRRRGCCR